MSGFVVIRSGKNHEGDRSLGVMGAIINLCPAAKALSFAILPASGLLRYALSIFIVTLHSSIVYYLCQ
jgi:hypothetical protein